MTPLSIHRLRLRLWWECLHEPVPFVVTLRYVTPQEGARAPYDFKPYWAYVNRIGGRLPFWPKHRRTIGAEQQYQSIEEVLKVARLQAFEILHPEQAAEIAARVRPVVPPPPVPTEHEFQVRLVDNGVIASCKCGWDGIHVGAVSGRDPECQVEFDRHVNEAEAVARAGKGKPAECDNCKGLRDWPDVAVNYHENGVAMQQVQCAKCGRIVAHPGPLFTPDRWNYTAYTLPQGERK